MIVLIKRQIIVLKLTDNNNLTSYVIRGISILKLIPEPIAAMVNSLDIRGSLIACVV